MKHHGGSPWPNVVDDLIIFPFSNIARNTNPGSIQVYRIFGENLVTGLIEAFFVANFPIINTWASNLE
jgi:hypothetical protein